MFDFFGKKSKNTKITTYVLLFGFLFQPLIVYWSSPWFFSDASTGMTGMTCALKGKNAHGQDKANLPNKKLVKDNYCSAVKLVDMANSTLYFSVPAHQSQTLYLIGLVDQPIQHQYPYFHYNPYSTRAPPSIS
jgi:hypothetical protein